MIESCKSLHKEVISETQKKIFVHSKQCWVVLTEIWVKYGQTQMLNLGQIWTNPNVGLKKSFQF